MGLLATLTLLLNSYGQLSFVSHINDGGKAKCVGVFDHYACLASEEDFFRIYDISNPKKPLMIGKTAVPARVNAMALSKDFAFVAAGTNGLQIYDLSDPVKPSCINTIKEPWSASGVMGNLAMIDVVVAGSYAYVANQGLYIYDISKPAATKQIWHTNIDANVLTVAADGTNAVLSSFESGLTFFDTSNPTNSRFLARIEENESVHFRTTILSNHLYTMNATDGLTIYDLSNPVHPSKLTQASRRSFLPFSDDLVVSGNYVYEANHRDGLRVYDISHPAIPTLSAYAKPAGTAYGVAVWGQYVFLANGSDGLWIYSLQSSRKK
jgi:hypothetical protein